jgi:hypothetical protein
MVKPITVELTLRSFTCVFSLAYGTIANAFVLYWQGSYYNGYKGLQRYRSAAYGVLFPLTMTLCAFLYLQTVLQLIHIFATKKGFNARVKPLFILSIIVSVLSFIFSIATVVPAAM